METNNATPPALGQVIGSNVQLLRVASGATQAEFTARCQELGLTWHRPQVSTFESGRARSISLSNLFVLAMALDAHPGDLLRGDGDVALNAHLRCSMSDLRHFLAGTGTPTPAVIAQDASGGSPGTVLDVDPPLEVELAKKFDVPVREIQHSASNAFEGRTVTQERDAQIARLGPLTKEQRTTHRGHVMRGLAAQIEADLRRRNQVQP